MKTYSLMLAALFTAIACHSQPVTWHTPPGQPPPQMGQSPAAAPARDPVNYLIRVEWTEPKGDPKSLEVLTAEGNFELDTLQKASVKINDTDIPVTLRFNGTLNEINENKGRLQFYLGRTVPYVTGTGGVPGAISSYSQMNVGLQSAFIVTYGKPVVVQSDENGDISVLVKRIEN
jgi:hypothetical protein